RRASGAGRSRIRWLRWLWCESCTRPITARETPAARSDYGRMGGAAVESELPDAGDLLGLRGKTVLVTGGGQGIGRAIAEHFAGADAKVGVLDLDGETARAVADSLPAAVALQCDVRDRDSLEQAAARVEADLGPIDVWVNNAGGVLGGAVAGLVDLDRNAWDRIFELNLTAVLFGCQ